MPTKPAEKPAAKPAEKPAEKPTAKPKEATTKPTDAKPKEAAAKPAAKPVEKAAAKPAEKAAAKPAEKAAAKPAKEAAAKPAKEAPKGKAPVKPAGKDAKAAAPKAAAPKAAAPKAAAPKAAAPKAAAPKKEAKSSTGLYVKNWGRSGVAAAKALFGGFGNITNVRLRRGRFCQVWFDNATNAKKAIDTVHKDKRGQKIQAVVAKSQPKPNRHDNTRVVCVRPIYRKSVTRKQLLNFFGEAGKVVKLRTYQNNTAYVYYDSTAAVARVIAEKSGKPFMGHELVVKPSVRSLESDKKKEERRKLIVELHRWVKAQRASG